MPRTPEQNKKIKDRRREKIMSVALKLFATRGYDSVTVDDITSEAKCSHGLFYHYFESKDDIFNAIMKDSLLVGSGEPPYEESVKIGGVKGLKLLVDYIVESASKTDALMYYAEIYVTIRMQEGLRSKPELKKFKEPMRYILTLVKQGQEEGKVINGDPVDISLAFYDFIIGAITSRVAMGRKKFRPIPADVIMGMLLKEPVEA